MRSTQTKDSVWRSSGDRVQVMGTIRCGRKKVCGPGSVVGIATAYGVDSPAIEFRWSEIFRTSSDQP